MSINIERIELEVNIDQIEFRAHIWGDRVNGTETEAAEYSSLYQAWVYNAKANEPDPVVAPIKGTRRPGDRASRRKANAHKKNALGRKVRYANEYINAYFVKGNGQTRWIDDIIKENAWDEFDAIDWSKVKGINPKNYGYKQYNKHPELIKSRHSSKEICRDFVPDEIDTVSDPWAYTDEEYFFAGGENLHGDFDDSATEMIYEDYHNPGYLDDDDEDFGFDPYQSALDDREAAWDTIADLQREIARYKDFLGEFNLTTLYERWLADNNS